MFATQYDIFMIQGPGWQYHSAVDSAPVNNVLHLKLQANFGFVKKNSIFFRYEKKSNFSFAVEQ